MTEKLNSLPPENVLPGNTMADRLIEAGNTLDFDIPESDPLVLFLPSVNHIPGAPELRFYADISKKLDTYEDITQELVLSNQNDFREITNLPQLLKKATEVMRESFERNLAISYQRNLGIRLESELVPNYSGEGELVAFVRDDSLFNSDNINREEISTYFSNPFLDVFMGRNYGDIIRQNSDLEAELNSFHRLLLERGVRKLIEPKDGFYERERNGVSLRYSFN